VLYIAYRGSGKSRGDLSSETDLFSDAQHWYSFSKAQFEEENILIVGQGFGGSIAAQLAASTNSNILILEHPYFSYGEYQAQSRFWWLPYNYFTSFQLKTWKEIRKTRCSIILMDEKQNVKENRLVSYLKKSDLSYWVNSENSLPYSSQPENDGLFKKILTPLTQH